jgi:hypothetical protein
MKQETKFEVCDGVEVAESPLLSREHSNRYGSIEDLPDEELADPDELERQFLIEEFAPILALPQKTRKGWIRPNIDEDGKVDWGAFATVDFDRYRPEFDKRRYKADRLKEELANQCLMMETISARLKTKAKYLVIKYVSMGILDLGEVIDFDMYCLAERYLQAKRLQRQIIELKKKSREKRQKETEKFWESL